MNKKPYITCPLEAALAVKNFGFAFETKEKEVIKLRKGVNIWAIVAFEYDNNGEWEQYTETGGYFYITEENLSLLEPVLNDDVLLNSGLLGHIGRVHIDSSFYVLNGWKKTVTANQIKKIIQRDGKPFPKIEWEERHNTLQI